MSIKRWLMDKGINRQNSTPIRLITTSKRTKVLYAYTAFLIIWPVLALVPASYCSTSLASPRAWSAFTDSDPTVCGECHPTQLRKWNMSAHAHAFENPLFQEQWRLQGEPDVCLECHTSHIDQLGEEGAFLGVSCEMCHGLTMSMNISEEDCSRCHSYAHYPTYGEWLDSHHSYEGVGCLDCHELHSLKLKAEGPTELCAGCHPETTGDWEEGSHGVAEKGCIDCHMTRLTTIVGGEEQRVTGHTFYPGVPDPDCESCHERIEGHMAWEVGVQGCLTCHDEIYMTKLHLANGSRISRDESSVLCSQCHKGIYYEWNLGMHGNVHEAKHCVDCHAPWDPYVCSNVTLSAVPINVPSTANQVLIQSVTKPSLPFIILLGFLGTLLGSVFLGRRWWGG